MQNNQQEKKVLLRISHLKQWFPLKKTGFRSEQLYVKANDDISLDIYEGETLGLVGESGCGKSTLGRVLLQLYHQTEGKTMYYGRSVESLAPNYVAKALKNLESGRAKLRELEAKRDRITKEYESLDEKGRRAKHHEKKQAEKEAYHQMLDLAQRIGIARSLAVKPKFVVCDEAVSALDVSIQSQVINLLQDLKEKEHLTYLFITHDLSVVKYISDRIAVMYLGNVVELARSEDLFAHPLHPYTEALLLAIPTTDLDHRKQIVPLEGDIPSPIKPPKGCKFHTRCKYATDLCREVVPDFVEAEPGHFVACHHILDHKVIE